MGCCGGKKTPQDLLYDYAKRGKASKIKKLLKNNPDVDIDKPDKNGRAAVIIAACNNKHGVIKLLGKMDADLDAASDQDGGYTALCVCTAAGHKKSLQRLIDGEANVDKGDCNGRPPVHIAVCYGRIKLLKILAENNANLGKSASAGPFKDQTAQDRCKDGIANSLDTDKYQDAFGGGTAGPRTLLAEAMTKKDKSGVEVTGERYADMQQMIIEFGGGKDGGW